MPDDLSLALEQHRQGCLDHAARLYRQILAARPYHADALHLLGVVAFQQGNPVKAAEWIGRAIARNAGAAAYHANLAEVYRALGQPDRAAACCRTALRLQPNHAEAANNLGNVLLEGGQVDAAAEQFRAALRLRPDFALACNNLGTCLRLLGDAAGALAHFRRAVQFDASLPQAQSNLGQLLMEHRQLYEALDHCRAAVRLRPAFAEGHSNLGNVLRELGRLTQARACYAEALRLNPNLALVWNNMGQAWQEEGRFDEALACYEHGLELDPDLARLHGNLASLLEELENYYEAGAAYETALRLDPNYAEAHSGLGWVRHEQGRHEEAQECFRTALRLNPDHAGAHCDLGVVCEELGDFATAESCFRAALGHDPRQVGAWSELATLLQGKLPEDDLTQMRRLVADPDLTDAKCALLHFGLAQVLDARKSYAEAGEHLRQANAARQAQWHTRGQTYNPAAHTELVDRLLSTFPAAFFERVCRFGVESERPIFIVGLPRSGTTLTEQVLASHTQVFFAGELRLARTDFEILSGGGPEGRAFDNLARLDSPTVGRLAHGHLEQLRALNPSALRVADKMPDNYLYFGLLATLFPRAKFIHCRRDLRDVAVSCWMTNFRRIRWASDFEHIAGRFRDYRRLMAHWRHVLPVQVLEVDYEETVADLEGVARRLLAWCGLEWEPRCLAFHEGKRPIHTASVTQVRQPVYTRSVGRWKNYQAPLAALLAQLLFEDIPADYRFRLELAEVITRHRLDVLRQQLGARP
jgi:tetratricopeptide (TPR) repeat protein